MAGAQQLCARLARDEILTTVREAVGKGVVRLVVLDGPVAPWLRDIHAINDALRESGARIVLDSRGALRAAAAAATATAAKPGAVDERAPAFCSIA